MSFCENCHSSIGRCSTREVLYILQPLRLNVPRLSCSLCVTEQIHFSLISRHETQRKLTSESSSSATRWPLHWNSLVPAQCTCVPVRSVPAHNSYSSWKRSKRVQHCKSDCRPVGIFHPCPPVPWPDQNFRLHFRQTSFRRCKWTVSNFTVIRFSLSTVWKYYCKWNEKRKWEI